MKKDIKRETPIQDKLRCNNQTHFSIQYGIDSGDVLHITPDMETGLFRVISKEEPDLMMMEMPSFRFSIHD